MSFLHETTWAVEGLFEGNMGRLKGYSTRVRPYFNAGPFRVTLWWAHCLVTARRSGTPIRNPMQSTLWNVGESLTAACHSFKGTTHPHVSCTSPMFSSLNYQYQFRAVLTPIRGTFFGHVSIGVDGFPQQFRHMFVAICV